MNTLKSALKMFIDEVEKLDDSTTFEMEDYGYCVIGQTVGWKTNDCCIDEKSTLEHHFGFTVADNGCILFSEDRYSGYTDEQWSVIRLFTADIEFDVTKQQWLKLAKTQLESMK